MTLATENRPVSIRDGANAGHGFTLQALLMMAVFAIVFDRFSYGPISASNCLLILTLFLWVADVSRGRRKVYGRKWLLIMGAVAAAVGVSVVVSDDATRSARAGFSILAMCGISFLIVNLIRDERRIRRVIYALLLAGILVSLSSILQAVVFYATGRILFYGQLPYEELGGVVVIRPIGFYWDPNYLGLFLIVPFLMGWGMWSELSRFWRIGLLVILVALLLTLSRGVLLPLGAFTGAYTLARLFRAWRRGRVRVYSLLFAIAAILGLSLMAIGIVIRGGVTTQSTITRAMVTQNALELISERPWFGWGPGKLVGIQWELGLLERAQELAAGRPFEEDLTQQVTHNVLLQMLLWIGMLGTVCIISGGVYVWRLYRRALRISRPLWLQAIALSLFGYLLTALFLDGLLAKQVWVALSLLISGSMYVIHQSGEDAYRR